MATIRAQEAADSVTSAGSGGFGGREFWAALVAADVETEVSAAAASAPPRPRGRVHTSTVHAHTDTRTCPCFDASSAGWLFQRGLLHLPQLWANSSTLKADLPMLAPAAQKQAHLLCWGKPPC